MQRNRGVLLTILIFWSLIPIAITASGFILQGVSPDFQQQLESIYRDEVPPYQIVLFFIFAFIEVVALIGIWFWKRIAVYVFLAASLLYFVLSFTLLPPPSTSTYLQTAQRDSIVWTLVFYALWGIVIKRKWQYFS